MPKGKIFSVDVETNGLYGDAFAIAVTVFNEDGSLVDAFCGRCPIVGEVDPFVTNEVLPAMVDIEESYPDQRVMEEAFWRFWMLCRGTEDTTTTMAIAHCPDPVETGLFRRCVERDLPNRQFLAPWPFHDLGTLLVLVGLDPTKTDYCKVLGIGRPAGFLHNPIVDAESTVRAWMKLFPLLTKSIG